MSDKTVKLSKKEFEKLVAGVAHEAINEKVAELGLTDIDRKFGMYDAGLVGKSQDELDAMDKHERIALFLRSVFTNDRQTLVAMKALAEGAGATGGFQVPEEFAAEINRIAEDFGLVRRLSRRLPMRSDTLNVPRLASSVSVTYPGENVAGTESEPVWDNVALVAKTAVGLTVASNEFLADANIEIIRFLTELFGEALASSEDAQGLAGTGAPFTGVLNDAGVNVVTGSGASVAAMTLDDYRDMISVIKPMALRRSAYFVEKSVWGDIQKKKDVDGAYHIAAATPVLRQGATEGSVGGAIVGELWGYPVYATEVLPDATTGTGVKYAIFGSLDHFWFGDRQQMTLEVGREATVGANNTFEQNQSAVRVTERIALAAGLPEAFAVLETA